MAYLSLFSQPLSSYLSPKTTKLLPCSKSQPPFFHESLSNVSSSSSNYSSTQFPSLSLSPARRLQAAAERRILAFASSSERWSMAGENFVDAGSLLSCPSLKYANAMYFSSGYNVEVEVEENEPEDRLLNRFRREVMRAGVIQEIKRRRYFENTQDKRKRKHREAAKRNSRRRRFPSRDGPTQANQETGEYKQIKEEVDEDNWELPDGDDFP